MPQIDNPDNGSPVPSPRSPTRPPRRAGAWNGKALAIGTTVALAGLAGVALNSNKGTPAPVTQAVATAHGQGPIVTRTSGSAATAQPVAARTAKHAPATPIVSRTSGGGGGGPRFEDD